MSCAGKGYGTNPSSDDYLYSQFGLSVMKPRSTRVCRRYKQGFLPSFAPVIYQLSITTSKSGVYALVYMKGENFMCNGTTLVKFGNMGIVSNVFYTSKLLAFVVPLNAQPGNYHVQAINIYNDNFSPQINQSRPGVPNYSNTMTYVVV